MPNKTTPIPRIMGEDNAKMGLPLCWYLPSTKQIVESGRAEREGISRKLLGQKIKWRERAVYFLKGLSFKWNLSERKERWRIAEV